MEMLAYYFHAPDVITLIDLAPLFGVRRDIFVVHAKHSNQFGTCNTVRLICISLFPVDFTLTILA